MRNAGKLLWLAGLLLVAGSLVLLVVTRNHVGSAQAEAVRLAAQLEQVMPGRMAGFMEEYTVMDMPVYQLGGKEFSGVLDVPAFGARLPIGNEWDKELVTSYPCRFSGTVYDGTLVIGGSDQEGQLSFLERIDLGDIVAVTDMTGMAFTSVVEKVERSKTAQANVLMDEDAALTLFARDSYALDYVIVRCAAGSIPR